MKRTLTLTAITLACLMAAGCVSTRSISAPPPPPLLSEVDRALLAECLAPVRLPAKLTQREIERLWISDRRALIECAKRHKALGDYYKDRDARLRGKV
jgi:hypothetical protein